MTTQQPGEEPTWDDYFAKLVPREKCHIGWNAPKLGGTNKGTRVRGIDPYSLYMRPVEQLITVACICYSIVQSIKTLRK